MTLGTTPSHPRSTYPPRSIPACRSHWMRMLDVLIEMGVCVLDFFRMLAIPLWRRSNSHKYPTRTHAIANSGYELSTLWCNTSFHTSARLGPYIYKPPALSIHSMRLIRSRLFCFFCDHKKSCLARRSQTHKINRWRGRRRSARTWLFLANK